LIRGIEEFKRDPIGEDKTDKYEGHHLLEIRSEDEMAIIWRRDTVEKRETGDQQTTILKSSLTIRLPPH